LRFFELFLPKIQILSSTDLLGGLLKALFDLCYRHDENFKRIVARTDEFSTLSANLLLERITKFNETHSRKFKLFIHYFFQQHDHFF